MPTENEYSLQDLADLAGVSPRTVRYYVAQGLLPSPGQVGPGARYTDGHLARLRLIRRLQRQHLPLAEIRTRLAQLDDETIAGLLEADAPAPPDASALDYVRAVLGGQPQPPSSPADLAHVEPSGSGAIFAIPVPRFLRAPGANPADAARYARLAMPPELAEAPSSAAPGAPDTPAVQRSQWDRVALTPDIELNIRRPLSRQQNKQVERLIAIARELLEEDPS